MPRKKRPMERAYMPLYVGRYLRKTRRLDATQHGAYFLILMELWEHDGSIPFDELELREIARVKPRSWKRVWAAISGYFTIHDGRLSHHFVTEQLEEFHEKRRKQSEGGSRGGTKSAENRKKNKVSGQGKVNPGCTSKAKGFASSLQEERQSLSDNDMTEAIEGVLQSGPIRSTCRPAMLDAFRSSVEELDGDRRTCYVSERVGSGAEWEAIRRELKAYGIGLKVSDQRVLDLDRFRKKGM